MQVLPEREKVRDNGANMAATRILTPLLLLLCLHLEKPIMQESLTWRSI